MIVLDTNVISEPFRAVSDPVVEGWLNRQTSGTLYVTATSLGELFAGVAVLPAGRRRDALREGMERVVERYFGPRVLAFDLEAAEAYGDVVGRARANGYRIEVADGQIAATALANGLAVATRDTAPFLAAGVKTINPWLMKAPL